MYRSFTMLVPLLLLAACGASPSPAVSTPAPVPTPPARTRSASSRATDARVVELSEQLTHGSTPTERRIALVALADERARSLSPSHMPGIPPVLLGALADPDATVRTVALQQMQRAHVTVPARMLTSLLADAYPEVRLHAAVLVAAQDEWEIAPELLPLLSDPVNDVRLNAAIALGVIGDGSAVAPLAPLLDDPNAKIAKAAHDSLVALHGTDAGLRAADWKDVTAAPLRPQVLARRLGQLSLRGEARKGIAYAQAHGALVASSAEASFFLGEMGVTEHDWNAAEQGYRACVDVIHKSPPPEVHGRPMFVPGSATALPDFVWACNDGLSATLIEQKRYADAVAPLQEALTTARKANQLPGVARAKYNLACAYANLAQPDDALSSLKESIQLHRAYAEKAKADGDFAPLREDPRFQALTRP